MKTSHGKNFNRYTFRVSGFVLANAEKEALVTSSVELLPRAGATPIVSTSHQSRVTNHKLSPGLEIDAND
jgi:hypothetical protein